MRSRSKYFFDKQSAHVALGFCFVFVFCCKEPNTVEKVDPKPNPAVLNYEATRLALERSCGSCHRSDLDTGLPGALSVFDLTADRWDRSLSMEQLSGFESRLEQFEDDDRSEIETYLRLRGHVFTAPE